MCLSLVHFLSPCTVVAFFSIISFWFVSSTFSDLSSCLFYFASTASGYCIFLILISLLPLYSVYCLHRCCSFAFIASPLPIPSLLFSLSPSFYIHLFLFTSAYLFFAHISSCSHPSWLLPFLYLLLPNLSLFSLFSYWCFPLKLLYLFRRSCLPAFLFVAFFRSFRLHCAFCRFSLLLAFNVILSYYHLCLLLPTSLFLIAYHLALFPSRFNFSRTTSPSLFPCISIFARNFWLPSCSHPDLSSILFLSLLYLVSCFSLLPLLSRSSFALSSVSSNYSSARFSLLLSCPVFSFFPPFCFFFRSLISFSLLMFIWVILS